MENKDSKATIIDLKKSVEEFVSEREWQKFHNPKSLSMAIAIEASELMEHFLWDSLEESKESYKAKKSEINKEVADILIATMALCNRLDIDIATVVEDKIYEIKKKYPADTARGKKDKYTVY